MDDSIVSSVRKRGGARPGSGRPPKSSRRTELKIDKAVFNMLERLKKGFSGNRTAAVEAAIKHFYEERKLGSDKPNHCHASTAGQTVHDLKTWPEPFNAVRLGRKNFEVRRNDRGFAVGDILILREYDPDTAAYSGRKVIRVVTYMIDGGQWDLPKGICVLGWALVNSREKRTP